MAWHSLDTCGNSVTYAPLLKPPFLFDLDDFYTCRSLCYCLQEDTTIEEEEGEEAVVERRLQGIASTKVPRY